MTLYLIGTGLSEKSISVDALEILKSCDRIYLEDYTVDFPYKVKNLEKEMGIKIERRDRAKVEDESIIKEAKDKNIALLVYGDPLSATTHAQLILESKKQNIECKIFHNASIITAIAETGLQLYKFGKTASMPDWKEHTNHPTSFAEYIKQNQSIKAHTLILTDIGLEFIEALNQLKTAAEREKLKLPEKIIVCSDIGTENQKIFYDTPRNLKDKKIKMPFCLIVPGKMHFIEEETLKAVATL